MGRMSREKGKRGEREVAALMRDHGFEARRGQQHRGGGDSPDVIHNVPGLHVEVKFRERINVYEVLNQAHDDSHAEDTAVVFHRRANKRWIVILEADAFLRIMKDVKC